MTSTAAPIETGQTVGYQGRRYTVAWISYNNARCACGEFCNKADLAATDSAANELGVRECQLTPAPQRIARSRHAAHATITLTPCEGPEQRWLVAVCFAGTDRIVRDGDQDMTYSMADHDRAASLGNALVDLFNSITIATALDALPKMTAVLNLAA